MPSPSGRPRSSTSRSGLRVPASARPLRNVPASCTCQPSASSAPRTKRRICGSSSMTTATGAVVDMRYSLGSGGRRRRLARQPHREFCASVRRVGGADLAAMRVHHRLADGQAQPDAGRGRFGLAARELVEQRRPRVPGSTAGRPGPWSRTVISSASSVARALTSIGGAPYLAAFSSRLTSTRSISAASNSTSGRSVGRSVRTGLPPSAGRAARIAAPTTSSTDCHSMRRLTCAALQPRHVQQVVDQRVEFARLRPPGRAPRRPAPAAAAAATAAATRPAPISAVSGVRTSCEIARQQRVAQALGFHLDHRLLRDVDVVDPLQRDGDLPRQRVELLHLLRNQQPARLCRLERQHAAHAHRRLQRHVVPGLRRQRRGRQARPVARCETPSRQRSRRSPAAASSGSTSWSAASVASTTAWPPKLRCTAAAPSSHTCELSQRGRQFARQLEQRLRAPLAAGRDARLEAQAGRELARSASRRPA